ncbi:hypothetical protein EB061_03710 [bacterium]|nr:hypothetical protein [bacterium]
MNIFILTSDDHHLRRVVVQLKEHISKIFPAVVWAGGEQFLWLGWTIRVVTVDSATVGWRADLLINLSIPKEMPAQRWLEYLQAWRMKVPPLGIYLDLAP